MAALDRGEMVGVFYCFFPAWVEGPSKLILAAAAQDFGNLVHEEYDVSEERSRAMFMNWWNTITVATSPATTRHGTCAANQRPFVVVSNALNGTNAHFDSTLDEAAAGLSI